VETIKRIDKTLFIAIALILFATALAKLSMLLTDPFSHLRVGIPNWVLWLIVLFEFWFASENIRMRNRDRLFFLMRFCLRASLHILPSDGFWALSPVDVQAELMFHCGYLC
jgi:hypothetical protein